MATTTNRLSELHDLHLKHEGVQSRLRRGPTQIEARKKVVKAKQQALEEAQAKHQRLKMDADARGLQLRTNEARIEELKLKLNTAASNKEFNLIKEQIEADTVANSVLEDEILEALERVDDMSGKVAEAEQAVVEAEKQAKLISEQVAAAEPGLRSDAEKLAGMIREVERSIPGEVSEQYRRLVQAHGADALASVTNSVCNQCYVGVTQEMQVKLNTGMVLFCKSCGRMLYLGEPL